jgi:hypothetical protein
MVSGSHSSPSRGSSHLSVALLSLLSVIREYLALRDGPRSFSRDFTWPDLLRYPPRGSSAFAYGTVTRCGLPFQVVLLTGCFVTPMWKTLQPRRGKPPRFGLFPFRSPLLRESSFLSVPPVTEMFQFAGLAALRLWIQRRLIRESWDQRSFVNFPRLFADFHALHRLLMPRHPPCALSSLTTNIQSSWRSAADALRTFSRRASPAHKPTGRHIAPDAIYRYNQIVKEHYRLAAGLPD